MILECKTKKVHGSIRKSVIFNKYKENKYLSVMRPL